MRVHLLSWVCIVALAASAMGCGSFRHHNLPPADRLMSPGPGVGGPGPGVLPPLPPMGDAMMMMPMPTAQVMFAKPDAMQVRWDIGSGGFDSEPLVTPARYNFPQGGIYRLKLTNISGRDGVELYPTVEIGPATARSEAFLAHNAIPIQFTEEDFDQVLSGNFVTKVIYLPDPEFQELALAGVETLVSTRLDPGVDPIVEADRRGAILGIIRLGNKDMEIPGGEVQAGFNVAAANCPADAMGPGGMQSGGMPGYTNYPGYVAGVTAPQWGMTTSGTPIGLPGPPHIPHGVPAGLQKHVMVNHTHMHLPPPTDRVRIDVKQQPGFSYPKPVDRVRIREQMIHPSPGLPQMPPGGYGGYGGDGGPGCANGNCN